VGTRQRNTIRQALWCPVRNSQFKRMGSILWGYVTMSTSDMSKKVTMSPKGQRDILNFTPGPQGETPPLGVNLAPRGEICPLGGMFAPLFTPRGEHSLLFRRTGGDEQRISPPRDNFTPRGQNLPLGTTSPLGSKLASRGEVKNGPLVT
jgi:hypothetical protein